MWQYCLTVCYYIAGQYTYHHDIIVLHICTLLIYCRPIFWGCIMRHYSCTYGNVGSIIHL